MAIEKVTPGDINVKGFLKRWSIFGYVVLICIGREIDSKKVSK